MKGFNLSDWALRHRSFVWFLMGVSLLAGALAYFSIGREEDPNFAIKTMIVTASIPGASVEDTLTQVTTRIEKKLEEIDQLDYTRSVTRPGEVVVYVELLPETAASELPGIWQDVRDKLNDIRSTFPDELEGLRYNSDFGDVFGNIYAFTSDGFSPRELRDRVDDAKRAVEQLPDAGKVEVIGARDEAVYLDISAEKLAALGIDQQEVLDTLSAQNAILPSGVVESGAERILVRLSGQFVDADSLERINLRVDDRFFPLTDFATVERGTVDPPDNLFRYKGQEAIALAVGMRDGANIVDFGTELQAAIDGVKAGLPIGIDIAHVADQPEVVVDAVGHFLRALAEAIGIVLIVSFVSLGLRAGLVVTVTIPMVLAITFVVLNALGFTLQRISLGALIIALGLLVDDAMIAIETMISQLERGKKLREAASYAWTSIAAPMLTGTLITVAGFIPIGLNDSSAGEFTFSLFVVIAVALVISWFVAVLFAPLLGVTMLSAKMARHGDGPGRLRRVFHGVLRAAMRARWLTIGITVVVFAASLYGLTKVENQFFPSSDRNELVVDVALPQNASIAATRAAMDRLEATLKDDENAVFWSSYVGEGAPRFILSFDVQTPGPNVGQIVIQTPSIEARDALQAKLRKLIAAEFPGDDIYVKLLEIGPPVGRPVEYRISGPDIDTLRDRARDFLAVMATDTRLAYLILDWNEPARVLRVDIEQDKARQLGLSPRDISAALETIYDGRSVTELRDDTYLVDVVTRGRADDRSSVDALANLQIGPTGIPLGSVARIGYGTEPPVIHQRNQVPTITAKAAVTGDEQPATIVASLAGQVDAFRAELPRGFSIEVGGAVESSADSQGPIIAVVPVMLFAIVTLVMIQMQSFRLTFIVLCTAPLGLIGVVAALLPSRAPLGFVAILGVLALVGILIRNAIILVHEIEARRKDGLSRWDAVFEGSDNRARPILLTAAAASLALIPISRQIFWGPMAYAMMGGIIAGTIITLVFVPALYLAVFNAKRETSEAPEKASEQASEPASAVEPDHAPARRTGTAGS